MFRLRLPEKQTGLGAGLGGFGWCERRIEVRFVWARRMFGAGLARVWRGFGRVWGRRCDENAWRIVLQHFHKESTEIFFN